MGRKQKRNEQESEFTYQLGNLKCEAKCEPNDPLIKINKLEEPQLVEIITSPVSRGVESDQTRHHRDHA